MKAIRTPYDGTKNSYNRIHRAIRNILGKASKCSNSKCSSESVKRYEWALKKGRVYSYNPDDYMSLCPSCHRRYDLKESSLDKSSESHMISKGNKCVNGHLFTGINLWLREHKASNGIVRVRRSCRECCLLEAKRQKVRLKLLRHAKNPNLPANRKLPIRDKVTGLFVHAS